MFGEWFQLRLVYNQGAAFGLHLGPLLALDLPRLAVLAVFVLNALSRSAMPGDRFRAARAAAWSPAGRSAT